VKDILIVLLVIALLLLIVGAANNGQRVDLDYVFGTWHHVSLFTLIAIAVAALVVIGLAVAAIAGIRAAGQRRKLERELEQTYVRLREAEAYGAQMAEGAAKATTTARSQEELPAEVVAAEPGPLAAGPDDASAAGSDDAPAAGPDDASAAGPDDRTVALHDQPGRDDA
jgi:uncharacterized membrane protein YciS (DUF1049 family)